MPSVLFQSRQGRVSWQHLCLRGCKIYASVNSSCAQPPSPPALLQGICPPCQSRGWGIANFVLPGGRGLPTPGPTPSFWHARGFLSEYNYTEDFTGKTSRMTHLSRTGKNWRGLLRHVLNFMHAFLHCLSSQNYIAKLGSYRHEWWSFSWYYLKNILSYLENYSKQLTFEPLWILMSIIL